jgi:hypothetical protein
MTSPGPYEPSSDPARGGPRPDEPPDAGSQSGAEVPYQGSGYPPPDPQGPGYHGPGDQGPGNPGPGYPGPGYQAPGYQGSGYPGSGYQSSGYPGSGYPGSGYPPPGYQPAGYPPAWRPTNQMAIAALVCGCAQIFFWLLAAIPAIILGHMARRQIRQTGEAGDGMALAGLILGYAGLVLSIGGIIAIIALVAVASHSSGTPSPYPP